MAISSLEDAQKTQTEKLPGFRLDRVEVFNWGTFHGRVWTFPVGGYNALLTGEIGAGKSSLVDAVTTLLISPTRLQFNLAAGADRRERTLRSYVLGYYKQERGDAAAQAKSVALRGLNDYSVILAHFYNQHLASSVTLAQVFWLKSGQDQPERFYVVATGDLGIVRDFSGFGSNILDLKRRLSARPDCAVHDTFKDYEIQFLRYFGLKHRQPLDLFNQAVSLKKVDNLDDFIRLHTLEPFDMQERITGLVSHFDNLSRAHESVLKAKRQMEMLVPIVEGGSRLARVQEAIGRWHRAEDALYPYGASLRVDILRRALQDLAQEAQDLDAQRTALEAQLGEARGEAGRLALEIDANGGQRIGQIETEIRQKEAERDRRRAALEEYAGLARQAGLPVPVDSDTFFENRRSLRDAQDVSERERLELDQELQQLSGDIREADNSLKPLTEEIASLKQRRSNIPAQQIELRRRLCEALSLSEADVPFVGELLEVRQDAGAWEGAIERVLHNFGLSLVVPEELYSAVAAWVDKTHLAGRLVYYRVREARGSGAVTLKPQSVPTKLSIKPDSRFAVWLDGELRHRFQYVCCDTLEEFRREAEAITQSGQIKGGRDRHEKDDRYRIDDRRRYVLGWDNGRKISALERERGAVQARLTELNAALTETRAKVRTVQQKLAALTGLRRFADFSELDWASMARDIEVLAEERRALEEGSDKLKTLRGRLATVNDLIQRLDGERTRLTQQQGANQAHQIAAREQLKQSEAAVGKLDAVTRAERFQELAEIHHGELPDPETLDECQEIERILGQWLRRRIDLDGQRENRISNDIVKGMSQFRSAYPQDTMEMDADVAALKDFQAMLDRISRDDLPRFEGQFKKLLNVNTIREIVRLQAHLGNQRDQIRERLAQINESLKGLDYSPGRYIRIEADPSPDREIKDFQLKLKACVEGSLTGSEGEQYSEAKFLQVKEIIERFRGRQELTEVDRRWTAKVTDVRNEFVFSASERWREDDAEYEHYTDSGGKSGGQKEKLAYTVLAASLAYQFGLDAAGARSFRFVVIDEAFGRGSDDSARYGLELFQHLGLQLLIVTPLQKIHIIEPYVATVGFVSNADGSESQLRTITIEEYRAEKEARRK